MSLSTLYDDADLDGDGLVGRVEKVLSKDPLTPDNPLTLTRRTDGSADNIATFVVPLNYDLLAGIGKLKLYVDGAPALLQRCDADTTSGNCLLTWDTTFEAPGAHNVQVALKVTAQTQPSGVGPLTPASIAVREASYQFTLIPGTPEWNTASPSECVASAVIPQSWVDAASTWQLLCSATISPYFRVLWVPGTSITEGYEAVKRTTELSVLNALEARPDLGNNVVRFLSTSDLGSLDGGGCPEGVPCMLDYIVLCQVAGSDAALNSMDLASRERLFSIAAWDVSYLLSHSDRFPAAAPARLMYIIYNKPEAFRGPLSGVTLPALSADQAHLLDIGSLPLELIPDLLDVKTTLGLTCRP